VSMGVRLFPAVHGHIADSVRAGQAVRRTACPRVAHRVTGTSGALLDGPLCRGGLAGINVHAESAEVIIAWPGCGASHVRDRAATAGDPAGPRP